MRASQERAKAKREKLRENLQCPYCGRKIEFRDSFREHIALNKCRKVEPEVAISMIVTDAKKIPEAELQRLVEGLAKKNGWLSCHMKKAFVEGRIITPTSVPGFPDLVLARPPALVFLELKAESNKKRDPDQIEWIRALQRCNSVEAYIVRPSDWREIYDLLTAK